ncbi:MAG TPA: hypothetical protein VJS15_00945 [Allosphingosinicella sp.]|nr:hypothetical protein [Allosphingosinicella sp.]
MKPRWTSLSGGCLLALAILAGAAVGLVWRQPSIGMLAGLGAGLVLLALVWLIDMGRR